VHVPLKGAPEMITETIAGRTQFGTVGISAAQSAIRSGQLSARREQQEARAILPDVPTVAEAGVPDAEFNFWIGVLAPARRRAPSSTSCTTSSTGRCSRPTCAIATPSSAPIRCDEPEQFDAMMREDLATLGKLLRDAGVKAN